LLKNIHVGLGICCQFKIFRFPISDIASRFFAALRITIPRECNEPLPILQFNASVTSTQQFDSSTARKAGYQQFNAIRRLAESTPQFNCPQSGPSTVHHFSQADEKKSTNVTS
jgi:hypothetical protein